MGRIIAIDYGRKRTGIAVTDAERIIASGLTTVATCTVMEFLDDYMQREPVDIIVVGEAKRMDNTPSESARYIEPFVERLRIRHPEVTIARIDERFTSKMAFQAMIAGGLKRKRRQNKALIDTVSAVIILQSYMNELRVKS